MNPRYSLDAEGRRWWWAPAGAGALCAVGITAVVAISAGSTVVTSDNGHRPGLETDRPCFIAQPRWNDALAGPQPACPLQTEPPAPPRRPGVLRPWLDTDA
jgi:hypothetical protein